MALDSLHPRYVEALPAWQEMRDLYKGERHVKSKGTQYLPATKSMILDGMGHRNGKPNLGQEVYDAYRTRALLPDVVKEAVEDYIGMLHNKPPTIELPAAMEPLRESATMFGEPLEALLRRINEQQLVCGRLGLLLDMPKSPDPASPMPYIALYIAEAVRNWDDGEVEEDQDADLNMVVLDESGYRRDVFDWKPVTKYRVLLLEPLDKEAENAEPVYRVGVYEADGGGTPQYVEDELFEPTLRGQTLDEIPFVVVNTKDITPNTDEPPLAGLGRLALAIYRGEADYRQNLFMQGQETFVVIGDYKRTAADPSDLNAVASDEPLRTGAGSMVHLEGGAGNDAKYVGVSAAGLAEQRSSLENDRRRAEQRSGKLANDTASSQESGEAKKTRLAAQTATLKQIALTGGAALEWLLKIAARWMGADENAVKVSPNLEFGTPRLVGRDFVDLQTAKSLGLKLSDESLHGLAADQGFTKMDYPTELATIEDELVTNPVPPAGTTAGGDPAADPPAQ